MVRSALVVNKKQNVKTKLIGVLLLRFLFSSTNKVISVKKQKTYKKFFHNAYKQQLGKKSKYTNV